MTEKLKLPKQIDRWIERAGLRYESSSRGKFSVPYFIGHGRRWRINVHGMLDVSCDSHDFDRWANSKLGELSRPFAFQFEHEFVENVKLMAEQARIESAPYRGRFDWMTN